MRSSYRLPLLFAGLLALAALAGAVISVTRDGAAPGAVAQAGGPDAGGNGPRPADAARAGEQRIRVEVLNGTSRSGLARRATARLRDAGFDVVYFGNAAHADSSTVLDRAARPEAARAVAAALGIARVLSKPDPGLYLDATVILGPDWPPRGDEDAEGWWARATGWLRK